MEKKKGEDLNENAIAHLETRVRAYVKKRYLEELRLIDSVKSQDVSQLERERRAQG